MVNGAGEPHVVPVGVRYNTELDPMDIGDHDIGAGKRFRDAARIGRATLIVDGVLAPWQASGVVKCAGGRRSF